jgi:NAD(P)-dependent dehydrogenase (short-subunit alcohol dehydrogenase family)
VEEVRALGAELAVVGNGARSFAAAFRKDFHLDTPLLIDPELRAYRAAGLRRGRLESLSSRVPRNALRALSRGSRQGSIQGDLWQLGGVFVIRPGGALTYSYLSREAGDHAPVDAILEALSRDAPVIGESSPDSSLATAIGRALSRLVDPTLALSFDRVGFQIRALAFQPDDLDVDLSGRRCLITGASSGIGYESALALADLGAEVVMLCRDPEGGEAAAMRIREQTGNSRISVVELDVSRLESVRSAAAGLRERPVDVLIHNASVLAEERTETEDGLELTVATHVLGPFLLTRLLQSALEKSSDARVIWVSSGGMYARRLHTRDPNWEVREFDGFTAYAETKRAQVVLAKLFAEELRGTSVVVNSMHPGWTDTSLMKNSLPTLHRVTQAILRAPAEGADSVVWLAASLRARQWTGCFFFDRAIRRAHLLPYTGESEEQRRELWRMCEEACEREEAEDPGR